MMLSEDEAEFFPSEFRFRMSKFYSAPFISNFRPLINKNVSAILDKNLVKIILLFPNEDSKI